MFKMISEREYQSVHFAEFSGFHGIELHNTHFFPYEKNQLITEKEYNKLRNKVLKLQKAL